MDDPLPARRRVFSAAGKEIAEEVEVNCRRCGECCRSNGLIPPLVAGRDESAEWLWAVVHLLQKEFAKGCKSEDYQCIFLTPDMRCAIHEMPERPSICQEFSCADDVVFPTKFAAAVSQVYGDIPSSTGLLREVLVDGVICVRED